MVKLINHWSISWFILFNHLHIFQMFQILGWSGDALVVISSWCSWGMVYMYIILSAYFLERLLLYMHITRPDYKILTMSLVNHSRHDQNLLCLQPFGGSTNYKVCSYVKKIVTPVSCCSSSQGTSHFRGLHFHHIQFD